MENHGCIAVTLERNDKYPASVPLIGLYIASASMVCSLLLLYDISLGVVNRQRWLPCRWFKLNSLTLGFMGVVVKVKLTVDLTTSTPTALDQFSKLAGTTSLCIYMCYIFPSARNMKDFINMSALTILVLTVLVNMWIQLSTGVVGLFISEHIAILCIMSFLLVILWHYVLTGKTENKSADFKFRFLEGKEKPESFLQRLKVCYLYSYTSNPQFAACRQMDCGTVGDLGLICLIILIQAAVKSVIRHNENFCRGKSDYGWSMKTIVGAQFGFVLIGALASYYRRFTMTSHVGDDILGRNPIAEPYFSNPIWKRRFVCVNAANKVYIVIIFCTFWLLSRPALALIWFKSKMTCAFTNSKVEEEFLYEFQDVYDEWTLWKSVSAMEKLVERSKRKSKELCKLLSLILSSQESSGDVVRLRYEGQRPGDVIVSQGMRPNRKRLLTLVLLVRIAQVSIPKRLCKNILLMFKEAFETLHFIEEHMNDSSSEDAKETEVARSVWKARDFRRLLPYKLRVRRQFDDPIMDCAFPVIEYVYKMMPTDDIQREVQKITKVVRGRSYSSIEELSFFLEDYFIDILGPMLAQLPEAIFKAVSESPVNEFQKRVGESLNHLCKFESWKYIHGWKVPEGCRLCPGLVTTEVLATEDERNNQNGRANPEAATVGLDVELTAEVSAGLPIHQDQGQDQGDFGIQVSATLSPSDEGIGIFHSKKYQCAVDVEYNDAAAEITVRDDHVTLTVEDGIATVGITVTDDDCGGGGGDDDDDDDDI